MDARSAFIFGMILTAIAGMLVVWWWFGIEDRHWTCIPINGYAVKYVEATRSTVETTATFHRNLGYRFVGVDSDMASKIRVYCIFERG